jgi:hypothetical protein
MQGPIVPERFHVMGMHRMREEEILADGKVTRLLRSVYPVHHTFLERLLYGVGATLVSVGEKLRDRYAPAMPCGREVYPTKI